MNREQMKLREQLAELEHKQWVSWSQSIAGAEVLSPERLAKWKKLWIPYSQLTERQKDQDRMWADKCLSLLHGEELKGEIEGILEAWEDEGKNYVVRFSYSGVAHEILSLFPLKEEKK